LRNRKNSELAQTLVMLRLVGSHHSLSVKAGVGRQSDRYFGSNSDILADGRARDVSKMLTPSLSASRMSAVGRKRTSRARFSPGRRQHLVPVPATRCPGQGRRRPRTACPVDPGGPVRRPGERWRDSDAWLAQSGPSQCTDALGGSCEDLGPGSGRRLVYAWSPCTLATAEPCRGRVDGRALGLWCPSPRGALMAHSGAKTGSYPQCSTTNHSC
jgi:hypothetical protein